MIVGAWPEIVGGVCNYTRPLHYALAERGAEVHYLFSGATKGDYDFKWKSYLRELRKTDNIVWYEIVNSKNMIHNYFNPLLDIESKATERIIGDLLDRVRPDVMHVHEIIGLPSSIIDQALERGINVFVTVHEYWWLCQHRVMVDYNGRVCDGPYNIQRCSFCVSQRRENQKSATFRAKLRFTLKNRTPRLFQIWTMTKSKFEKTKEPTTTVNLEWGNIDYLALYEKDAALEKALVKRLWKNIERLNKVRKVIAVSNDVKDILIRYGVRSENITVQHIGSDLHGENRSHRKQVDPSLITLGYIGGVGYYKGVHNLVEVFTRLPDGLKMKAELKIFGAYDKSYYNAIRQRYLMNQIDADRVKFYGRYSKNDLDEILNQIDIMVLPSLCNDTAPQTLFEAYSAQIPVIAPNIGGFPDFVKQNYNGLLYNPNEPDALLRQLECIILRSSDIERFRRNIPLCKTIDENVDELMALYSSRGQTE
jgi:glycosyltransferase involved in cell wall biosynthesis